MEDTNHSIVPNKVYNIAKEISKTKDEEEKQRLFENLGALVQNIFKNKRQEEIDHALQMAVELEEQDVVDIIMNDAELEVETISFEKMGEKYISRMLVLPFMMLTKQKVVKLPSIMKFQDVIQAHLLAHDLIERADQFMLAAIRFEQENIIDLDMQDWWNLHSNSLEALGNPENTAALSFASTIDVENGVSMYHLVPMVITKDSDNIALKEILNTSKYSKMWQDISKELSIEQVGFNIVGPHFIVQGIAEGRYLHQTAQLQLVINDYRDYDNIELGYIRLEEDEDSYAVFVFDSEDNSLADFFIFETDGNTDDMITMLVTEVSNFDSQKLWYFESTLSDEQLEAWCDNEEQNLDITKLLEKSGHPIDIPHFLHTTQGTSSNYLH